MKSGQRTRIARQKPATARAPKLQRLSSPRERGAESLTEQISFLQRTVGNQAVGQLLSRHGQLPVQRRPAAPTGRPGAGTPVVIQRGLLSAMSTFNRRIFGTDSSIAQFVAQKHETTWSKGDLQQLKDERTAKKEWAKKLEKGQKIPQIKGLAKARLKEVNAEIEEINKKIKKGPPPGTNAPTLEGFEVVRKALEEEKRLITARDLEIQQNGHSDINPDDALLAIPEEYRPRRITPSEKAVKSNKLQFLEEDSLLEAQKQRKIEDIHAVRVMKMQLGIELKDHADDPMLKLPLEAQLKALEEIGGPDDIAKLDPGAVEEKLQKATLKGRLKAFEKKDSAGWSKEDLKQLKQERDEKKEWAKKLEKGQKIPQIKGLAKARLKEVTAEIEALDKKIKKGPRSSERDSIEAELTQMAERKKQKTEIVEKIEAAAKDKKYDKETRDLLGQLKAWVKGKGAPTDPMSIVAVASTGVEVLGEGYKDTLLAMINMKGANDLHWKKKLKDTNAETAGSILGGIGTTSKIGSGISSGIKVVTGSSVEKVLHKVGGQDPFLDKTISGSSHYDHGRKVIDQVGTSQDAADIMGAAGNLLSLGNHITDFVSLAKALEKGDPAEQLHAIDEITKGVFGVGQNLYSLGSSATKLAGDFGGTSLATELGGHVLPIFDIASGALGLVQHGLELKEAASRISGQGDRVKDALSTGAEHIALAIGQFKRQGAALVTSSAFAMAADILKIVGGAITLSGIGAIVGQPIKLAGSILSVANKAGMALYSAFKTGKGQEARAGDMLALPGSSEKLMKTDPKHASQALIREARAGNQVALDELASYGVSKYVLDSSSDFAIRKLMLSQLKLKEEGKTVGESVKQGVQGIKDWWHEDTSFQLQVLATVKNKLNYGGRSDRGTNWKNKIRLGGDAEASLASMHKILTKMGPEGRKDHGITEEEYKATRPQHVREQDKGEVMTISWPSGSGR